MQVDIQVTGSQQLAVEALCISLDKGEAEAIVLASEKKGLLIIDDGDGRKAARQLGLKITGTIESCRFKFWELLSRPQALLHAHASRIPDELYDLHG